MATGSAMKRGGFARCMIDAKSDENESTRQARISAQLEPLEGKASFVEHCIKMRLNWLKARCGVRDYDALSDLCVILDGGGCVTPCASHVYHCIQFVSSSCRGEVCIYMTSTHRYFRIHNFIFECFISMTCERMHTQLQSTLSDEHVCTLSRSVILFHSIGMHSSTRSLCSLLHVCIYVRVLLCKHSHCSHAHTRGSSR